MRAAAASPEPTPERWRVTTPRALVVVAAVVVGFAKAYIVRAALAAGGTVLLPAMVLQSLVRGRPKLLLAAIVLVPVALRPILHYGSGEALGGGGLLIVLLFTISSILHWRYARSPRCSTASR